MKVYVGLLLWVVVVYLWSNGGRLTLSERQDVTWQQAVLVILPLVMLLGLRSAGGDTESYIQAYQEKTPSGFSTALGYFFNVSAEESLYDAYRVFMRTIFGRQYEPYLLGIAAMTGALVGRCLYKHSECFFTSMMLFMLWGYWSWMTNGIRQFLAVAIAFAAVTYIERGLTLMYLIFVLVAARIHTTTLIMIPVYFLIQGEPWKARTILTILLGVLAVVFSSRALRIVDAVVETTSYANTISNRYFTDNTGSSVMRTLIYALPPALAFLNRRTMERSAPKIIKVCVNMSIVCVCISAFANVTSGIYIGRLPIYFSVYNLILVPWMLVNVPIIKHGSWVPVIMGFYVAYFTYANYFHAHPYYVSELLHLRCM